MKELTFIKMSKRVFSSRLILGFALAVTPLLSFAQTTITLGTATSTTDNAPVKASNAFHYSQCIYTASNIIAGGASGMGTISKIRYYYSSGTYTNSTDWTVYIGHTNKVNFASTTDWITIGLTTCFSGTVTFPAAGNWLEITLTTPFQWNGVDNIVIGVDENEPGSGSGVMWRYSTYGSDNRTIFYGSGTTNPDPMSPPTAVSRGTWAPNLQLDWTAAPACSGIPSHTTAIVDNNSICPGESVNLSLSGVDFSTGLSYLWQYNDGSGWMDYPNSNAATFTASPATTMDIRGVVTCTASAMADTSDIVSVTVNSLPAVVVDVPDATYCSGSVVTITASGADTYTWSPSDSLDVTTGATVNANPSVTTTYTVTGTNTFGCSSTATSTITPLTNVVRSASYSPFEICSSGSPVAVQAMVTPAVISGGSTWEYRFFDSNGAVLQNWNASDTYNFVPATDSVYDVYYQVRVTGCTDTIDSNIVSVIVGFGTDLSVSHYNCVNLGGTIQLSSIFAQETTDTVYMSPLANATTDLTDATLYGNASITGGRAVLTPSATSKTGLIMINNPSFHTGFNNAYAVSFKMTADQPINTWGTGGADGICYSFGDDLSTTGEQNGSGSKLRLSFDAADNSPNLIGIYLVYGTTSTVTPTGSTTLFYAPNASSWKLKTDVQVDFKIDLSGQASLALDGEVIFTGVQMPDEYMGANTTGWKHSFGARTGGDALRQAVSDVVITSSRAEVAIVSAGTTPTVWEDSIGTITGLQPGSYDVWMRSAGNTSCSRLLETVEVLNNNPLVELGPDTTICEGSTLLLDAGNVGATYVWGNSQITTQTNTVSQEGSYVVYVTDSLGCVGIGSIIVDVMSAPSASNIFVQQVGTAVQLSVMNPQNVTNYTWDFGDGTTEANAPGSISHTYPAGGVYSASVTLTNDCGTATIFQTVIVNSTASLTENEIEGLKVYPNPASNQVTIELPDAQDATVAVVDMTGATVIATRNLDGQTILSVQDWAKGVYFVRVQNEQKTSTVKLVIH